MLNSSGGRPPHPRMHAKGARRLAVALTVPLLMTAAACGSDSDDSDDTSAPASSSQAKVAGDFGAEPKITVPKDAKAPEKKVVKTVVDGKGEKIDKKSFVRLDFAGQTMKDGKVIGGTWAAEKQAREQAKKKSDSQGPRRQFVGQLGAPSQELPEQVMDAVAGKKVGSRIVVEGDAKTLVGEGLNPQSGIKPEDGLVWVLDVVNAQSVDAKKKAEGEQAKPADGLPEVKADGEKAATISIPKGDKAPTSLKQQVLIKGDGAEVKAGDGLIAQYTGVKWEDGKKFDSSWDHEGAVGATAFQIGTGSVVPGWDKGLVGKHIGDRVELVIPPKLGYAGQSESGLDKNTLVFVVDIVGKA